MESQNNGSGKTTSSTHVSVEKSMFRNSLWCEMKFSLDVFHIKKIKWKRPFNVVTLFRLAGRARPRHLQPHPNSERQIALNDNESLPSYGKVNFPKILPPTTPHLWNPGTNLIHRVVCLLFIPFVLFFHCSSRSLYPRSIFGPASIPFFP